MISIDFSDYTVKDYFDFLEKERINLVLDKTLDEKIKQFYTCCYLNKSKTGVICDAKKVEALTKTSEGIEKLKAILTATFGRDMFNTTDEQDKELEEKYRNLVTKSNFDKHYGKIIGENPKSYDDIINIIIRLFDISNSTLSSKIRKEKADSALNGINSTIANALSEALALKIDKEYTITFLSELINAFNKKGLISIYKPDNFEKTFNNLAKSRFLGNKALNNELGTITLFFVEQHNKIIRERDENKDEIRRKNKLEKKLKKQVYNYFDVITTKEDLKNEDFPRYSDENVVDLYNMLDKRFDKKIEESKKDDEIDKLIELKAITQMMYVGYFASEYYDEEKVFKKVV